MVDGMFDGKRILITGGTGSLGQALTKRLLKSDVEAIRIFSRNENKQVTMDSEIADDRLRFFIGDIRDLSRLNRAMENIDIVFHAAALKHVPVIEYNPFEAVKTNVIGTQNIIDSCIHENIEIAVGVGTDKAVSPLNAYGATKLLMEKLFVTARNYLDRKQHRTKFITLRYGNVLGSSGSVVPKLINQIKNKKKITITDPTMTRFSITMDEALDFIIDSTKTGTGSEIFVPKLRAYSIADVKDALIEILGDTGEERIPVRAGEKFHEVLINSDEMRTTWETDLKYGIFNHETDPNTLDSSQNEWKKSVASKPYSSEYAEKISKDELKSIISKSNLI